MTLGSVEIEGCVVTVPAAFNQMQCEATMRSASIAGLERVALLQEPIAAAMAAISGSAESSGRFLVYDLGGGTFDAAIVQSASGNATVVGHAGVNMLGGSDFDRAIVNELIRPWLLKNFDIPADFQTLQQYDRLIRIALYQAEIAKISLSSRFVDHISANESQIGIRDRSGVEVFIDVEITREFLEGLVINQIDRSIDVCRELITDNGFSTSDIEKIVMIGGPSRMPVVRRRVAAELGIAIDNTVDPMTAVAVGAALYAEGRNWEAETPAAKSTRAGHPQ
jgi:molecular chaperone DnaK